jgi:uncharacterized protein YjbI with pentapeptide repeats
MDELSLAKKLLGNETTTEEKAEHIDTSNASIVYMVAVTSSSGGEVILRNENESIEGDWSEGDYIELDEDGDFEEYESEDDELEDVDDTVVDMTDGDGVNIEESETESLAFTVAEYQEQAQAEYEEEVEAEEDDLADENSEISDELDDGDAEELPDDGEGEAEEDELSDEDAEITDLDDTEYELIDDNSDDESDEVVTGAEISDGYTVAECIGVVNEGDRVAVMVQNGQMTVLGVAGSGDEQKAEIMHTIETLEATNIVVENLQATKADITDLNATNAKINKLEADIGNIADLEAFNATIQNLQTNKADINLANVQSASIKTAMIDDAQITTSKIADASIDSAKIKEGAITEATIHDGAITSAKIADASITNAKIDSLNADKITAGTLKTERLILVDDETGNESVITALNREAVNKLDGATIQDSTIEAAKIDVADLNAFEATIGGFDIDSSSIHSNKTAINDKTAGVYVGTTGIGVGDGELADVEGSPVEVYADGTVKIQGKNGSIKFDAVVGDLDIEATNFMLGSKTVATVDDVSEQATAITENSKEIIFSALTNYVERNEGATVESVTKNYLATALTTGVNAYTEGWSETIPTLSQTASNLWVHEAITFTDESKSFTEPFLLSTYNGKAITSIVDYYAINSNKDKAVNTTETGTEVELDWSTSIPTLTTNEMYLWSYSVITYSDGSTSTSTKRIIAEYNYSFSELKETIQSQLQLLSDQMTLKFTETLNQIESVNGDLQDKFNTITKYFTFDIEGLKIGSTYIDDNGEEKESPFKVVIDEDEFIMKHLDKEVLKLDSQGQSHIPDLKISQKMNLFGYEIYEDENGNVNCEYIG